MFKRNRFEYFGEEHPRYNKVENEMETAQEKGSKVSKDSCPTAVPSSGQVALKYKDMVTLSPEEYAGLKETPAKCVSVVLK